MGDEDQILIGEGVVLDSGAAPVTLRILSGAIDLLLIIVLMASGLSMLAQVTMGLNSALGRAIGIAWTVACLVILPATVETLSRGRSLGRWAIGLRVVRDDGGPVSIRHALTRALVGVLEVAGTAGMLAVTVSMLGARGKRIGDHLAGTYAMRTRGPRRALPPVTMPDSLASWAATADITRLPDGLALTSRLFLGRADALHPASRVRVGSALAAQMREHVAPAPPAGTHPEDFLSAVLAERRDREWAIETTRLARARREGEAMRRLPYRVPDAD